MQDKLITSNNIKDLIYTIRGKQVMLDSDLAHIYKCTNGTKDINKAVKRNIMRFPEDFYFQISNEEYNSLRFHNGTLKSARGQHKKYLPYAFTEQGVAMLASVLRTDIASQVNITIMRAFVEMHKFINSNKTLFEKVINIENKIDQKFIEYDQKFDEIFNELQSEDNIKQKIFLKIKFMMLIV